jgi:hypothetical protein
MPCAASASRSCVLHLFDEALAAAALVVEQARDLLVGLRLEVTEREVFEFPLQLPDAEAVGERRVDVARELRERAALVVRQRCGQAQAREMPRQQHQHHAQVAHDGEQQATQAFAVAGATLFGMQRPHLRGGALAFEQGGDLREWSRSIAGATVACTAAAHAGPRRR